MGIQNLPLDEQKRVFWTLAWIGRMAKKYGDVVYEKNGEILDWGQALCRECYGPDWNNKIIELDIDSPSCEDIERAKKWEKGEIPDWVSLNV